MVGDWTSQNPMDRSNILAGILEIDLRRNELIPFLEADRPYLLKSAKDINEVLASLRERHLF